METIAELMARRVAAVERGDWNAVADIDHRIAIVQTREGKQTR